MHGAQTMLIMHGLEVIHVDCSQNILKIKHRREHNVSPGLLRTRQQGAWSRTAFYENISGHLT